VDNPQILESFNYLKKQLDSLRIGIHATQDSDRNLSDFSVKKPWCLISDWIIYIFNDALYTAIIILHINFLYYNLDIFSI